MTQRQLLEARECDYRSASGLSGLRQASGVWPRDAEQGGESGFALLFHHGLGGPESVGRSFLRAPWAEPACLLAGSQRSGLRSLCHRLSARCLPARAQTCVPQLPCRLRGDKDACPGLAWGWVVPLHPQVDGEPEGRSHSFLGATCRREEGQPVGTGTQPERKARCLHLS